MGKKKYREKYKSEIPEKYFIAYIIKGNRQIIRREINASKRFKIGENTYYVLDHCIFNKNIEGKLTPVAYYRENNPRPYDFINENTGFDKYELDKLFAEDFHNIMMKMENDKKMVYMLIASIFNVMIGLLFMVLMLFEVYIL